MASAPRSSELSEQPARSGSRSAALVAAAVLVLATAGAYLAGGLEGPFLFDDLTAIVENGSLDGGSPAELLWPAADTSAAGRPLLNLSFAASLAASGLDARAFRLANLGLHAANALLVLWLVRRTLESPFLDGLLRRAARPLALAASLVWALHPIHSETVLYVVQRSELLAAFFSLAALACAVRTADVQAAARGSTPASVRWSLLAGLCAVLGVLSKESAAVVPVLALLHDRTFVSGRFATALARRRLLHASLFASWIVVAIVLVAAPRAQSVGFGLGGGPLEYARAQGTVVLDYMRLLAWPDALVFDYGPLQGAEQALVPALVVLALGAGSVALWLARPVLGFAFVWFFATIGPTSSFVPIVTEVGAERRVYLGSTALVALAAALAWRALARLPRPASVVAGAVLVAALVALEARGIVLRSRDYRSDLAIWTTVVERRPANARGHYNLGVALSDLGRPLEAVPHYREAVRLDPAYAEAHDNLGAALAMSGDLAQGLVHARRAVELAPTDAHPWSNLALTLYASGDPRQALQPAERAIQLDPEWAEARANRALILTALDRRDEAEAGYRAALALDPDLADARFNLARLYAARGARAEALAELEQVLARNPADADARALAQALRE